MALPRRRSGAFGSPRKGRSWLIMSVTFKKAPLVELIAELRWGNFAQGPVGVGASFPNMGTADSEQFFMRLGAELFQYGFKRAERLVPPHFPILAMQPVYRFRRETPDTSMLFQAGAGVFSIHAIPPYRSWKAVKGVFEQGVDALLKARSEETKEPFKIANLRYINGFGPELTENRNIGAFLRDILGFKISIPDTISDYINNVDAVKPSITLAFSLSKGKSMNIAVGDGIIDNAQKIVLDMSVFSTSPVEAEASVVMRYFTEARDVIHGSFIGLTKPIEHLLEPESDEHAS
jgi:uncharacterized protein (TIGR04255 family)